MLQQVIDFYYEFEKKNADPRTEGWFLVRSPVDGIVICLTYVFVVTVLGPRFMKNRQPMNIRSIMLVYNFLMVLLSAYMVYLFLNGGWLSTYTIGCQLTDRSRSTEAMNMVLGCYLFYVSKYIEFLDTIFFIMRKKMHQVTFLHVWHHAVMPASWFAAPRFEPGGMCSFPALINSCVHVAMYTYYGIAALGPEYQKYIWWKKYLTKLQIIQFVVVIVHAGQSAFTDCDYPRWINYWLVCFSGIFLILFSNFYIQEYIKRLRAKKIAQHTSRSITSNGTTTKSEANGVEYSNGHGPIANGIKED